MRADQIEKFLAALGIPDCGVGDEWVQARCPLAPWFHKSGTDSHPSFGIKIENGGHSNFNCYSCLSGSLETLVGTIEMQLKNTPEYAPRFDLKAARAYLDGEEVVCQALPGYREFTPGKAGDFQAWPEWYVDSFPSWRNSPLAAAYLAQRMVSAELADQLNLRWDPDKDMVCAPYSNLYGKLAGMRGRAVRDNVEKWKRHFDYKWNGVNNAELTWYNEQCLQLDKPVLVVEGQFDAMRVIPHWPSVVAGLGAKVTQFKLGRLASCRIVVFMLDHDDTGKLAFRKQSDYLSGKGVKVGQLDYPEHYKDPGCIPMEELQELLDPLTKL